jgi:hypothetical protein
VRAKLSWAGLGPASLSRAILTDANLSCSFFGGTIVVDVDLSEAKGLSEVPYLHLSTIGIDTLYKSKGRIPDVFLREAGVPEGLITFLNALSTTPIDSYSCLISYSSRDELFTTRLHADLIARNLRCWFAPEDLKIGHRFQDSIEESHICPLHPHPPLQLFRQTAS